MSLIENLQEIDTRRGILFIAIETLKEPAEIYQFFTEYIGYLGNLKLSHLARHNPEEAARRNIGYVIPFYETVAEKWRELTK